MRHARSVFFGDRLRRQLADRPQLADGVATLLDEPERWIRRRVERIDVERLDEAGSSVSLDAWLEPAIAADVAFDGGERLLVPVGYGIKGGRLAQFDLTADGTPAALLSFPENVVLSAAVLDVLCARHGLSGAVSRAELEVLCGPSAASAGVATALRDAAAALPDARAREAVERWVGVFERRYVLYASIPHDDGRAQRQLVFDLKMVV